MFNTFTGFLVSQSSDTVISIPVFFNWELLYELKIVDWDLDGRNQISRKMEIKVCKTILVQFFWHFLILTVYQDYFTRKKTNDVSIENLVIVEHSRLRPSLNNWIFWFWQKVSCTYTQIPPKSSLQKLSFPVCKMKKSIYIRVSKSHVQHLNIKMEHWWKFRVIMR